jgi:hypothetical protein
MSHARRSLFVTSALVSALFAAGLVPSAPASPPLDGIPTCPLVAPVEDVGPACRSENGLLAVYSEGGAFLGFTHGVDHADPLGVGDVTPLTSIAPVCVKTPTSSDYYTKVIYAHPTDVADSWATKSATILSTIATANGALHDAATATGGVADIKVQCDSGGSIVVFDAALAHTRATTTFSTVSSDLTALGYSEINAKHWVFVDGGSTDICSCGVGNVYGDDTLVAGNLNNGASGTVPEFSVDYAMTSAHIALHELSHNMGAVQHSAPHSTWLPPSDDPNAWHCNDGLDTMCYNDGGHNTGGRCSSSNFYCAGVCSVEVYDCMKDDYFNRAPSSSNYLFTHWNIGNTLNKFVGFGIPTMSTLSCTTPRGVTQVVTCMFTATDDSTGVRYTVAWGDASSTCVPSCSTFVSPGTSQSATHTYSAGGTKTVSVTATDNGSPAQTSAALTTPVLIDATPPITTATLSGTVGTAGWYRSSVTVTLAATDTGGTGVGTKYLKVDAGAFTPYSSPVTVTGAGSHTIQYYSVDVGGNVETTRTTTFGIDTTAPTITGFSSSCSVCVASAPFTLAASDALSGLNTFTLTWWYAQQGSALTGTSCIASAGGAPTYTTTCFGDKYLGLLAGQYCYQLRVTDRAGNAATSAVACVVIA